MRVEVKGGEQLDELARQLRAAGAGGGLRREVVDAIERAVDPLPEAARSSALSVLPSRGGLAARVARSVVTVRAHRAGSTVGVSVEVAGQYNLQALDDGTVRHPVFGRGRLVTQRLPRDGWLTQPVRKILPGVDDAVEQAMQDVADKITHQ